MPDKVVTLEIDSTIVEGRDGFVTPGGTFTPGGAAIDLEWNTGVGGQAWFLFEHGIDKYARLGTGYNPVTETWDTALKGAVLTLMAETDITQNMTLRIRAELARNPEAPTSTADLEARTLTTKYLDWALTPAGVTVGVALTSADLADVINEVLEHYPPDGRSANLLLHVAVQTAAGDTLLGVESGEADDQPSLTLRTHSTLNIWRGDAPAEEAVLTITINAATVGELFAIDFHEGRAEYTSVTGDTTSTIATALAAIIEDLGVGITEVATNVITLTGAEGVPIHWTAVETTGTSHITIVQGATGLGPNWFSEHLNWSLARPPSTHDTVAFEDGDSECTHGLVAVGRVTSVASDDLNLEAAGNFVVGQIVRLFSTGTLPQPASPTLTEETDLYVTEYDAVNKQVQVSLTRGGTDISWSTQGTGDVYIGVRLRHMRVGQAYGGRIGHGVRDDNGRFNARPRYLSVGFLEPITNTPNLEIGVGLGGGAGRLNVDGGATLMDVLVADTGGPPDDLPACNLKCEHEDFRLVVLAGDCGLAPMEGDHSVFSRLQVFGGRLTLGNDVEPSEDAVIETYGGGELNGGELIGNRVTIRNRGT